MLGPCTPTKQERIDALSAEKAAICTAIQAIEPLDDMRRTTRRNLNAELRKVDRQLLEAYGLPNERP